MIFIQDIGIDKPLNTYNNNIIEYKATDTSKTVSYSIVTISGVDYELTPNLNDVFRFNFLQIAKTLNNQNNFRDELEPDIKAEYLYNDSALYNELTADIKIVFTDETEEIETKVYQFLKSVEQIIRKKAVIDSRLFPLITNATNVSNSTYFEGHPCDIAFYSDADREVTLTNKNTLHHF